MGLGMVRAKSHSWFHNESVVGDGVLPKMDGRLAFMAHAAKGQLRRNRAMVSNPNATTTLKSGILANRLNRYSFWKGAFPSSVLALAAAQEGFKRGLELMDEAMNLDDSARIHMPKPTPFSTSTSTSASAKHQQQAVKKPPPSRLTEVTFKGIAEEYAAEHNLLFMPTGRVHEKSRIPMHRVTGRTDGKGGIVVYILDDVVWAVDGGTPDGAVTAVTFEEMVLQASKMR